MSQDEVEEVAQKGPSGRLPHPAHMFKKDFEKHGYTDRCPRCSCILRGMKLQPHTDACKKRMAKVLEGDARIENAKRRKEEHEAKGQEKHEKR